MKANLPTRFALAKNILLGEDKAALDELGRLRSAGELSDLEIEEWPIFDRLRLRGLI